MIETKIQLPIRNFEAQEKIFNATTRFVIVPKGRRFGATRGAANNYMKEALAGRFKRGLWGDTVNSNIERYVERYFLPALSKLPEGFYHWRKQQKILRIRDAIIDFRSADTPENWEGFDYDKAFLNEAGIILKNEYLWNNAIKPMLWDKNARVVVAGTPKGRGVFYELYQRGLDPEQKDYTSFKFSSFDNPYVPAELVAEDIKSMPERVVRQEIYAEFLDDNGVVFRGVKAIATLVPKDPIAGHMYVMGVDLAKVQDFTVISVYDRENNHQVFQMRFNKLEWPYQRERIKEVSKRYNNALILIDATGLGDPIADDLARERLPVEPVKFTNESKKQMIEKLSNWIELSNLKMLQLEETIQEFNNFTYDFTASGKVSYNAPAGFHDDIVMSHALAIWSLNPIYKEEAKPELSPIAKDIYEKTRAQGQSNFENSLDYDII